MRRFGGVTLACSVWVLVLNGIAPRGMAQRAGGQGGAAQPAQAPEKTPADTCLSCCYLPCIEAEMLYLRKARDVFQQLADRRTLTTQEYEAEQERQLTPIDQQTRSVALTLAACALKNLPNPAKREDYVLMRRWNSLNWKVEEVVSQPGHNRYDYFVKTSDDCEINEEQLKEYRTIVPCGGFADAVVDHEGAHVKQCQDRKKRGETGPKTPKQFAKNEVGGYDAEYKYLDRLRQLVSTGCSSTPCTDQVNEAEAKRLESELTALKEVADRKKPSPPPRKRRTP
jgi:hypothetical protein